MSAGVCVRVHGSARCTRTVGGSQSDCSGYGARGTGASAADSHGLADNGEEPPGDGAVLPTDPRWTGARGVALAVLSIRRRRGRVVRARNPFPPPNIDPDITPYARRMVFYRSPPRSPPRKTNRHHYHSLTTWHIPVTDDDSAELPRITLSPPPPLPHVL